MTVRDEHRIQIGNSYPLAAKAQAARFARIDKHGRGFRAQEQRRGKPATHRGAWARAEEQDRTHAVVPNFRPDAMQAAALARKEETP